MAKLTNQNVVLVDACPACTKPITGHVAFDVTFDDKIEGGQVKATLTASGCRVSHDCTPKVTRGVG